MYALSNNISNKLKRAIPHRNDKNMNTQFSGIHKYEQHVHGHGLVTVLELM